MCYTSLCLYSFLNCLSLLILVCCRQFLFRVLSIHVDIVLFCILKQRVPCLKGIMATSDLSNLSHLSNIPHIVSQPFCQPVKTERLNKLYNRPSKLDDGLREYQCCSLFEWFFYYSQNALPWQESFWFNLKYYLINIHLTSPALISRV
jgi:hypothetical protein